MLWLWCRPAPTAPIRPLAWEPPCAAGAAQKRTKRKKKKKEEEEKEKTLCYFHRGGGGRRGNPTPQGASRDRVVAGTTGQLPLRPVNPGPWKQTSKPPVPARARAGLGLKELLEFLSLFFFFESKQSLYQRKANSSQGCWEGGEEPPPPIVLNRVLSLKGGGQVPTWGPERCGFLPLALLNYPYQPLSNSGSSGWECPVSLTVSLLFSSRKLSHRGLGINVHLGVGTLPRVNKACGDATPWRCSLNFRERTSE